MKKVSRNSSLIVYRKLSFFKKYSHKFLFVSFVGIHIPLLGIIAFLLNAGETSISSWHIASLTLALTLVATGATLWLQNELLKPLTLVKSALDDYTEKHKLPQLPNYYEDEAGLIMSKLQNTLEQLQQLLDEKQDLISLLSHDLKSPINQIKGLVSILQQNPEKEESEEYLQLVSSLCDQHASLLSEVVFILKHKEKGKAQQIFEYVNLQTLLKECIQDQQYNHEKKELTFHINSEVNDVYVLVEKIFFRQAIRNLIENAIKFSYQKGRVHIVSTLSGSLLHISIKDEGVGFAPELAPQLFDKFTSQGRKGTFNEPSTGLGLHLTKKIIEQHEGEIEASSEGDGKGATFTIKLRKWKNLMVEANHLSLN